MESRYALTTCSDASDSGCYAFDETAYSNGSCYLDKCNGRVTAVPAELQAAFGATTYAYYMTSDATEAPAFPYQPYCYRGDAGEPPAGKHATPWGRLANSASIAGQQMPG
ncbi:MAG: hypothetical protein CMP23_09780 [Rickettsiales bacterium]|nr:hypothetical protein [Rickettsiales bacterium]